MVWQTQGDIEDQAIVIQQLNQQIHSLETTLQNLRIEHEQTTSKLHEERK